MRRGWAGRLAGAIFVSAACVFLILPTLIVVPMSFTSAEQLIFPPVGFSLRWYVNYATTTAWRLATLNSVLTALGSMVLATVLGTLAALAISRGRLPFRGGITTLFLFPMIVPSIVTAVAIYNTFAKLHLTDSVAGMILAHTILGLPFVVINVLAVLQKVDWRIVDAARSCGATPTRALFLVTLPAIMPGVLAGAVFAFVTSFDEVVVALFVSSPETLTLPRQLFSGLRDQVTPALVAIATVLIALSIALMMTVEYLRNRAARLSASTAQ